MSTASHSEKAYEHIRRRLFNGELAPGARLVNRALASEIGMSLIPVREAISRLVSEGLVDHISGAGAFVRTVDRQELSQLYDVRDLFEPHAAAEAARLRTDHELDELRAILAEWDSHGKKILSRKRGATAADLDRWLELNERFHEVLITASRNRFLVKITNDVHVLSQCFAAHRGSPGLLSKTLVTSTLQTHRTLLDSIKDQDATAAEAIVRKQLRFGRESVLAFFDQQKSS
ncbi:MAG: GntR family transcriptional regulator [Verrucomicrobiota bacterium]